MRTTGKMKGLFTDTELNFENIKASFLQFSSPIGLDGL